VNEHVPVATACWLDETIAFVGERRHRFTFRRLAQLGSARPAGSVSSAAAQRQDISSGERNEVVFANALQDKEDGGGIARIGDEVWSLGRDCKRLARRQSYLVFGVL
jgi:hypothetical protein